MQPQIPQIFTDCCRRFSLGSAALTYPTHRASRRPEVDVYSLFQEDSACPASHMSILRQIRLCNGGAGLEQRADPLDYFESNLGNILRAQPFQDRSALKRNGQAPEIPHAQVVVTIGRNRQLIVDPVFFVGSNHGCSPDILTNLAPESLLQIRNHAMSDAIAQRREIFV